MDAARLPVCAVPANSGMPRYQQLRLMLRQRIKDSYYAGGCPLPGERELAAEFGVARVTVRTALSRLEEEGLLVRLRSKGTFVVQSQGAPDPWPVRGGLLEGLLSMGSRTKVKVLDRRLLPAPPHVAAAFGIAPGTSVLRVTRIRTFNRQPIAHTEAYAPLRFAACMTRQALTETAMLVLIEEQGVRLLSAEQTMDAAVADHAVAQALGLSVGSPLLRVSRVVFDDAGQAVQCITGLYHPERYEYHMRLSRSGGETKVWVDSDQTHKKVKTI